MTGHIAHDSLPQADGDAANALIASLNNPQVFDHPVEYIRLIETHISWVILTGNYAYKIKKPVNFGFLDFSTVEKRHFYCDEELRLNRRFAPQIYLELITIRGSLDEPRFSDYGDEGEVIEYAIKMLEFPQQSLLSNLAADGQLDKDLIDDIAVTVANLHANSETAAVNSHFGESAVAAQWSDENLVQIAKAIKTEYLPNDYFGLKRWYQENQSLLVVIDQRKRNGFVRECHGDLHLGNMALLQNRITPFDCIEFNPELRWIDTISEAAFIAMDLYARGYPEFCWRFLNLYLETSDDYGGILLLRYYFVYRALVRAKVEALRLDQKTGSVGSYLEHIKPALKYIEIANRWAGGHRAGLIIMHGLSGSGKSTVAEKLVEALGAVQIRSDVIRKKLFNIGTIEKSGSALGHGIYTADATAQTYQRLREIAATVIDAGFTVIVDAAFLLQSQRRALLEMELSRPCSKIIIDCDAPETELRRRIEQRTNDPSEANLEVLQHQLQTRQPIGSVEETCAKVVRLDSAGLDLTIIQEIEKLLDD